MKKLFFIALCSMLALLTACSGNTVTYNPEKPYWLNKSNYGNTVVDVSETCIYDVTYQEPAAENKNTKVEAKYFLGTYTTSLTDDVYNETPCYVYKTTLNVSGEYVTEDGVSSGEFTGTTTSTTYFLWNNGFEFLYSEQTATSTLPVNASAVEDANGNRFITIAYKTTIAYGQKDATSTFEIVGDKQKLAPYFSLTDGASGLFKKYKKTNYLDSNMMYFAVRAFNFDDKLSYSFSSIDILNSAKHSMILSVSSEEASKNIDLQNSGLHINGGSAPESVSVYNMVIGINETYSGASVTCQYVQATEIWFHVMYSMETALPYQLGSLKYTLKDYTHN